MNTAIITSEIVSIAFLCVVAGGILCQKEKEGDTAKLFFASVAACIFGTAMDAISYLLDGNPELSGLLVAINILAIGSCDFMLIPFAYYVWSLINEKQHAPRWFVRIVLAACLMDFIFIVIGSLNGRIFTIENGTYTEGSLFKYMGVIPIMVMFCFFSFVTSKYRSLGRKAIIAIWTYFLLPTLAAIFDLTVPGASFVYPATALVLMVVYVSLQSGELERRRMLERVMYEASNTDVLTDLNNRRAYERRITDMPAKAVLGVLFCDLNGLKYTNDNFGHSSGDALLLKFADLLKEYFEDNEIFRISGDEFVVLMQNANEEQFRIQTDRIRKAVVNNGEIAAIGSVYGMGSDVLHLIQRAEKNMYAEKSNYYKRKGYDRRK